MRQLLSIERLVGAWDLVEHEPPTNFFHGDALGFMWNHPMLLHGSIVVTQTDTGATPQLLGAHRSNVDEQKTTLNRWRFDG